MFARIKGNGEIRLINCIFKGNQAFNGAGIFAENKEAGSVVLINNTFSGNEASNVAGGANFVFEKATSACQIYNNIFWNNLAVLQPGLLIRNDTGASVNLFNNDMEDYKVSTTATLTAFSGFALRVSIRVCADKHPLNPLQSLIDVLTGIFKKVSFLGPEIDLFDFFDTFSPQNEWGSEYSFKPVELSL